MKKVCLIKVPSETLKNLRGESYRPPKKRKNPYGCHVSCLVCIWCCLVSCLVLPCLMSGVYLVCVLSLVMFEESGHYNMCGPWGTVGGV